MSKRKNKKMMQYLLYPVIFILAISALSYAGGRPLLAMARANMNMLIEKGAPSYSNEYNSEFTDLFTADKQFNIKDIQIPEYGAHYGNILCQNIDMKVPLYYGDSDEILEKGAGQYIASGLPGEGRPILIGGHDSIYFQPLEKIAAGDSIEIQTNYGIFTYKVTETKVAEASDSTAYSLIGEKEQLILYTCYPFGKLIGDRNQRFFVYCNKTDGQKD